MSDLKAMMTLIDASTINAAGSAMHHKSLRKLDYLSICIICLLLALSHLKIMTGSLKICLCQITAQDAV